VLPLALDHVAFVVCNSGSDRRLEASAYNERRAQCDAAVAAIAELHPEVRSLRDVTSAMLDGASDRLEPVLVRRARHVVGENERVLQAATALEAGDAETAGRLFGASHASLRDLYEVSSPELDTLVEVAGSIAGVFGSRLTGAGFGGCTVNLVRHDAIEALTDAVLGTYAARTGLSPQVFEVRPAHGAEVIDGWA
jgi:galactokinase